MSSWIWMKGVDQAIADTALDPVSPEDDRASVPELLEKHAAKIEQVKAELKSDPLYEKGKHDDLWILRFLLSHKQETKPAILAAKSTLLFRKEYNLDQQDTRFLAPHKVKEEDNDDASPSLSNLSRAYSIRAPGDALIYTIPDKERGVVAFLKFTGIQSDPETLKKLSNDDWDTMFIYSAEWTFQWLDYVTRKTGRLTKSIRIINLEGASLFNFHRQAIKRDGKILDRVSLIFLKSCLSIFHNILPLTGVR
jgi:hypothetical protein